MEKYLKYKKKYTLEKQKLSDRDKALVEVKENGMKLKNYPAFNNDEEVVLAAVSKDGFSLEFASERLKNDKKIVLAAASKHGYALKFASEELQNDTKVASIANSNL